MKNREKYKPWRLKVCTESSADAIFTLKTVQIFYMRDNGDDVLLYSTIADWSASTDMIVNNWLNKESLAEWR